MPKNIVLKGSPIRKEGAAGGTITPGNLISTGSTGALVVHAVASGIAAKAFAVEQDFLGKGIDANYSSGDRVQYVIAGPGDEIYAIAAASQTIAIGDFLVSGAGGKLAKYVAQKVETAPAADVTIVQNNIVGRALEAVTTTDDPARIRIEVV